MSPRRISSRRSGRASSTSRSRRPPPRSRSARPALGRSAQHEPRGAGMLGRDRVHRTDPVPSMEEGAGMPAITRKRLSTFIEPFRVEPGRKVRLPRDFPTTPTQHATRREARALLAQGVEFLAEYQARLAAQDTYGVVVVLQAM